MVIGERLKQLREERNLSQGNIEERTGLLRCYISRVENGHTVPSIQTLEKWGGALKVPLYRFFYDGDNASIPRQLKSKYARATTKHQWGESQGEAKTLREFRRALSKLRPERQRVLFLVAARMSRDGGSNRTDPTR